MNERTGAQLRVIKAVINALGAVGISAWLSRPTRSPNGMAVSDGEG
jgi:hypothetical protein